MNPFRRIPTIMSSQELLDYAYHRAAAAASRKKLRMPIAQKVQKKELIRLNTASQLICQKLNSAVKGFPSLEQLHPFYRELAMILVDADKLRKTLASLSGTISVVREITRNYQFKIRKTSEQKTPGKLRSQAYGRISSVIKRLDPRIAYLNQARKTLRKLPGFNMDQPTIVVAGAPNTGKSTLIRRLSKAKPEISHYPFTTKELILGYFEVPGPLPQRVQIVDTPGLLDRTLTERNPYEKQAIAAIKYLASLIIFMVDPSETGGYNQESQYNLYHEVQKTFIDIPMILVFNKIDLTNETQMQTILQKLSPKTIIKIIATQGTGIDNLLSKIIELLKSSNILTQPKINSQHSI